MMTELRNPFGLRGNSVILIEDIPKEQNGLKCGCVCPACKEPFEARMGDVRRHHFAHSGQGCDEVNAYMAGLYMILQQYISEHNSFYLPPVIASYRLSGNYLITQNNVATYVRLISSSVDPYYEIFVSDETYIRFETAQIEKDSKNRPQAILAECKGRILAIRITPPDTVCKWGETSKYKEYPTLEIDFTHAGDKIQSSKREEFINYLQSEKSMYRWIFNRKIETVFPKIYKLSRDYYDKEQARLKKIEGERRKAEAERRQKLAESKQRFVNSPNDIRIRYNTYAVREAEKNRKLTEGYQEIKGRFTENMDQTQWVKDRFGTRWIQCRLCGKIKPAEDFGEYGGMNRMNTGTCKECCFNGQNKK